MKSRLHKDEISEKGIHWYESTIKHELFDSQLGMDLAIEVETGQYEIGDDSISVAKQIHERVPNAQVFLMKHGFTTTLSFGFRGSYRFLD